MSILWIRGDLQQRNRTYGTEHSDVCKWQRANSRMAVVDIECHSGNLQATAARIRCESKHTLRITGVRRRGTPNISHVGMSQIVDVIDDDERMRGDSGHRPLLARRWRGQQARRLLLLRAGQRRVHRIVALLHRRVRDVGRAGRRAVASPQQLLQQLRVADQVVRLVLQWQQLGVTQRAALTSIGVSDTSCG